MRLLVLSCVAVIPIAAPMAQAPALARQSATLLGLVTSEETHRPLDGVIVRVARTNRTVTTTGTGSFRIDSLSPGDYTVEARKLGFRPFGTTVRLEAGQAFDVELIMETVVPPLLAAVDTRAEMDRRTHDIMERKLSTQGTFFLSDMLDSARGVPLGELLQKHAKGAKMVKYGRTGASMLSITRGMTSIIQLPAADPNDRKSPRACYSKVIVDGITIYAPDVTNSMNPPDLNQFDSATLFAVEFYPGPATTPAQFAYSGSECGTLVVWTKNRH